MDKIVKQVNPPGPRPTRSGVAFSTQNQRTEERARRALELGTRCIEYRNQTRCSSDNLPGPEPAAVSF